MLFQLANFCKPAVCGTRGCLIRSNAARVRIAASSRSCFAEALSDDGSMTGRGLPHVRGGVTGLMTAAGGIGHTLPFLLSNFHAAFTVAIAVVAVELAAIRFVRHRYMATPLLSSAFQVIVGGATAFAVGILIGSS